MALRPQPILLVGLEPGLAEPVERELERAGFPTTRVAEVREGIARFLAVQPAAVIIRDTAPGLDGWDAARRVRELSNLPIIFVSDQRDVFALERALHVADAYLTPPYRWIQLVARLKTLLRRAGSAQAANLVYADDRLHIDFARRQVFKDGQPVHLTDTEFKLLSYFVRKPDRVLPYSELLTQVWGHTHFGAKSHASLYVRYLRKKLEDDPAAPVYFKTEWGVGYSFRPRPAAGEAAGARPDPEQPSTDLSGLGISGGGAA